MTNRKTIIYIGGFQLPDKNAAAQRVMSNAKALLKLGYKVVFVDIDCSCEKEILETKTEVLGCDRFSMRYTNRRLVSTSDFTSVFAQYEGEVCAVIAYNYPGVALWKMLAFCKKHGVKLIADCTEWYGVQGGNLIHKTIKGFDSYLRMNVVHPKLDGMIAISRLLEKEYQSKLPTICVPPLVDMAEQKWNQYVERETDSIRLVFAGVLGRGKDSLGRVLNTLNHFDQKTVKLVVVGITKDKFIMDYPELSDVVAHMGDSVVFLGRLSHQDAIKQISQSDFSVFYREKTRLNMAGFPTKFVEAISCGTPVLTNKTSDLEEYLVDGVNGFWINDIEHDLRVVLKKDQSEINDLRNNVNRQMFDYHEYIEQVKKWLESIFDE